MFPLLERPRIVQNNPVFPVLRADYIHPPNGHEGMSHNQGVKKTRDGLILRPDKGKSLRISARQKTLFQGGLSHVLRDVIETFRTRIKAEESGLGPGEEAHN